MARSIENSVADFSRQITTWSSVISTLMMTLTVFPCELLADENWTSSKQWKPTEFHLVDVDVIFEQPILSERHDNFRGSNDNIRDIAFEQTSDSSIQFEPATFQSMQSGWLSSEFSQRWQAFTAWEFKPGNRRVLGDGQLFIPLWQDDESLIFADLRGQADDSENLEGNWGIGLRKLVDNEWIWGAYGFVDNRWTENQNHCLQGTLGIEALSFKWDFRANGYIPEEGPKSAVSGQNIFFQGNNIVLRHGVERAYYGLDAEIGRLLESWADDQVELRGFVGGFHFDNDNAGFQNISGPRVRLELRAYDLGWFGNGSRVTLGAEYQWDQIRDDQVFAMLRVRVPLGRSSRCRMGRLERRMVERIVRDVDIVAQTGGAAPADDVILTNGGAAQPITVNHVKDSGATGDGTIENPHASLTDANADMNKSDRDIVYVHSGTNFQMQEYALAESQRLLGEGGNNQHFVQTDQLGRIILPQVNGTALTRPTLDGDGPGEFSIAPANNTEVSNFDIVNSQNALDLDDLSGNVNVNRMSITSGNMGVVISRGSGTFTLTDVTITDTGGDALRINGGSANIMFGGDNNPDVGLFGGSTINQGGMGRAINFRESNRTGHSGTFSLSSNSTINATGDNGLQFQSADGTYNFNGTVSANGVPTGINIDSSSGTFTFANVDIDNTTIAGISIDGSAGNFTFASIDINNSDVGLLLGRTAANTGMINFNGGSISNAMADGVTLGDGNAAGSGSVLNMNNISFDNINGFTINTANGTLSGSGNTDGAFSCMDAAGNMGSILFNSGADSCP